MSLDYGNIEEKFPAEFKKKVVLEALKEHNSISELATKYEVHATQITEWKKQFLDNSEAGFNKGAESKSEENEKLMEQLYARIGQLKVENDWLKKKNFVKVQCSRPA